MSVCVMFVLCLCVVCVLKGGTAVLPKMITAVSKGVDGLGAATSKGPESHSKK